MGEVENLRTGQGFCRIFRVTGMTETHMGIPLLNIFPTKEIKSYKMCLALLCSTVCDGAGTALHASGKVGTGWEVQCHKIRTLVHTRVRHTHTCAHTSSARREQQPGCSLSRAEGTSPPPNLQWETPQAGQYLFTGYLLYLLTEYLEYFLRLNRTRERKTPLNCDQPDCRQNLKHSPISGSMCKDILPPISREV